MVASLAWLAALGAESTRTPRRVAREQASRSPCEPRRESPTRARNPQGYTGAVGKYRARDLVNGPTLVSWLRVPLAALFPFSVGHPWASVCVLGAAGLSDVLDGWLARRSSLATPAGAVVDGVTDKLFAGAVLATLVARGDLSLAEVALLGAREVGELPLVLWVLASPAARRRKLDDRANLLGKFATTLQFVTVFAVLVGAARARQIGLWSTAVVGLAAATSYWARALSARRREGP